MRVAIITESYAPDVNGVANSVRRIAENLVVRGHSPLVIAPQPKRRLRRLIAAEPYPVLRLPSLPMPGYGNVRLGLPNRLIKQALREHKPDLVHLASPFVLGAWGGEAAAELGLPIVAVFQTDIPGYAGAYGVGFAHEAAWRWVERIHARAALTLAPSSTSAGQLQAHGVPNVSRWGRGVDTRLFHPLRRNDKLRGELAPGGEVLVGYVGRLAKEKRVELLHDVAGLPGTRLVIVGDGPTRAKVARALPGAAFLGAQRGLDLARLYASLDVFVHTGPHETFCQTVQEAQASGIAVVAPACGGPADLITSGVNGILVPPNDPAAIAEAVTGLAADAQLRRRLGTAARSAVSNRTWPALVDQLITHYQSVTEPLSTLELVA